MSESQTVLNVRSDSLDWRAHMLSNLSCAPFHFGYAQFASTEGFIQGIKYPEGDPRREQCFESWGELAKKLGQKAERKYVWWKGEEIPYGTPKHHQIIAEAIYAKFHRNTGARVALLNTEDLELIHDVGPDSPHTSLPANVFCAILAGVRTRLSPLAKTTPP